MFDSFGSGVFNITNTTIDGNTGGGIYVDTRAGGTINLINDTIANNEAGGEPAGIAISNTNAGPGTVTNVENTILANNIENGTTDANCGSGGGGFGFEYPVSLGHNISDDTSCSTVFTATGDINNENVHLGALVLDNYTYVLPITASSPAYNAADPSASARVDERGVLRPQCGTYDIGAYEYAFTCPVTSSSSTSTPKAPSTGFSANTNKSANIIVSFSAISASLLLAGVLIRKYSTR
jgi:hypothetical protein